MHLITETSPRVAIVRELCSKYYLADGLVHVIGLGVIPQVEEIVAKRMGSKNLLTIADDSLKITALIAAVPTVVGLRGTEEVALGEEMGSCTLQDTTSLER